MKDAVLKLLYTVLSKPNLVKQAQELDQVDDTLPELRAIRPFADGTPGLVLTFADNSEYLVQVTRSAVARLD